MEMEANSAYEESPHPSAIVQQQSPHQGASPVHTDGHSVATWSGTRWKTTRKASNKCFEFIFHDVDDTSITEERELPAVSLELNAGELNLLFANNDDKNVKKIIIDKGKRQVTIVTSKIYTGSVNQILHVKNADTDVMKNKPTSKELLDFIYKYKLHDVAEIRPLNETEPLIEIQPTTRKRRVSNKDGKTPPPKQAKVISVEMKQILEKYHENYSLLLFGNLGEAPSHLPNMDPTAIFTILLQQPVLIDKILDRLPQTTTMAHLYLPHAPKTNEKEKIQYLSQFALTKECPLASTWAIEECHDLAKLATSYEKVLIINTTLKITQHFLSKLSFYQEVTVTGSESLKNLLATCFRKTDAEENDNEGNDNEENDNEGNDNEE